MTNIIFYYTGTGNSLHAAKRASAALGGAELIHMGRKRDHGYKALTADAVGFVFPVYSWGPPPAVEKFVRKLDLAKPDYLFSIITHGGAPGDTLPMWNDMLKGIGLAHDAGWLVRTVDNYIPFYNPPDPEKQAGINERFESALDTICERIKGREKSELKGSLLGKFARYAIHPMFVSHVGGSDKNWRVLDTCTGCGLCAKVCSVGNITMSAEKRPTWNHACEQCMACFHWCPEKALTWGKKGADYNHYHHPGVKAAELFPNDK